MGTEKEKPERGNFSFDSIDSFDDHINTSIPRYSDIHACIDGLIQYFVTDAARIYDIGCSTGSLLRRIDVKFKDKSLELIGIDQSANLLPHAQANGRCQLILDDVTGEDFEIERADIAFCIFTLCFIPLHERYELVQKIYDGLHHGGVLISTDKIYAGDSKLQDIFTFLYYDFKRQTFQPQEILDKEISLREIQKPITQAENEAMFYDAGFDRVESFWKYYNFQGWICIK